MRNLMLAVSALGLLATSTPGMAGAQCRDARGKFAKCLPRAPAKTIKCRDSRGHFVKCARVSAKPA